MVSGEGSSSRRSAGSMSSLLVMVRPSMTASAIREVKSRIALMASSLPGMMWSIMSGSQFVSTMATTGMRSLRASATAMCSFFGSITKMAWGSPLMDLIPERTFSSF